MKFSERMGLVPQRVEIQRGSMDGSLRNRLWNALEVTLWSRIAHWNRLRDNPYGLLILRFFGDFLKVPIDGVNDRWTPETKNEVRQWFFGAQWYEVYDFLEFLVGNLEDWDLAETMVGGVNQYLEEEQAAYRVVGRKVAEITKAEEVEAIESALAETGPLAGVNEHLRDALSKLTDRKNPDYRNSIKESISAIESLCRVITGDPKATLGDALKRLEEQGVDLHPALKKSWGSLYGYTSDEEGIRHSLLDESQIRFSDAKYMLVSCSAFSSHLLELAREAGIALE